MISVVTNNGADYTLPTQTGVVIRTSARFDNLNNSLLAIETAWTISGVICSADAGDISTQVTAMKAHFANRILVSAKIKDGGATVEELLTSASIFVESVDFPEGDGPEWATKRAFSIVIRAEKFTSDITTNGEYSYIITYSTEQSGIITRTITGELVDTIGKVAYTKYTALKAAQSWVTWTNANLIEDTYSQDKNNTKITFSIIHKKYWTAYGAGITNAMVSEELSVDSQNVVTVRVSGWFEGTQTSCNTAINAVRRNDVLVGEVVTRDIYENRTSFSLEYIRAFGTDILYYQQTLSIQEQLIGSVFKQVLGNYNSIKQVTARNTATATQSGVIRRLRSYPIPPKYYWNANNLKQVSYSYSGPESMIYGGRFIYTLTYNYEFEFSSTPRI